MRWFDNIKHKVENGYYGRVMIHGLSYDFIVANLSCYWEYYIYYDITMLIDERLRLKIW